MKYSLSGLNDSNHAADRFMPLAKHLPAFSRRRTGGVSGAWWLLRWALVLVLAFDHLSAPFHHHHHDGAEGRLELVASHVPFGDGTTHAEGQNHSAATHSAMAIRIDPSRLGQLAALDNAETQVALISVVELLGTADQSPPPQWRPDRYRFDFRSHRSLPPAGRAPPLHA